MAKGKGWVKVPDASMVDWDKQKSKPIEGTMLSVTTAKSKTKGKEDYKVFKVETPSGIVAFTGTQLEQKLSTVKKGTKVKIVYTGKQKTSKGFKVNTFDVYLQK